MDINEKHGKITEIIWKLAEQRLPQTTTSPDFQNIITALKEVYTDGYRHSYSNISSKIFQIVSIGKIENQDADIVELLYLSENIKSIQVYIDIQTNDFSQEFKESFRKLSDHIQLEIARIDQQKDIIASTMNTQRQIKDFEDQIKGIGDDTEKRRNELDKLGTEMTDSKNQIISHVVSVLAIFAGIVIAFMTGTTLLSSAFSVMQNTNKYRLVFVLALVGLVLFDLIISLMFIVARLCGKDIGIHCKCMYSCYVCPHAKNRPIKTVICQAVNKYPYICIVNILLVGIMYVIFILWLYSINNKDIFPMLFHTKWEFINLFTEILLLIGVPILLYYCLFRFTKVEKKLIYSESEYDEKTCG